ncbi:uncharacterized protein CTRU02_207225 [Colletotrichum truncatum]|uniref:Uncharacterized protein n=1 Tax=Colletotrichum truncatum TaxID=5467 RepID=A0ACC3Z077_COLTU|nr:uncharacterized protein CTRU02_01145 [Colletotrichum truncatum]KAF6800740.1 hypothetical protein CTRU02_01145 [Colletotrichum truncatum]
MSGSTDKRAQPWQKWYAPLPEEAATGRLMLIGNNGNDNFNRHVFGTCSPATVATEQHIASQRAGKDIERGQKVHS